jgi:glycosyltransferase involved in cell wall biosynthesis
MRALFVITAREVGGGEIIAERLIRKLSLLCECTVVLADHLNLRSMCTRLEEYARVETFAFGQTAQLPRIMRALQNLANGHQVIHLNSSHPASRLGILCGFALGGRRAPLVCVEHRVTPVYDIVVPRSIAWALPMLFRRSRRRAERVVAVSEDNAACLRELYRIPSSQIAVVHNGIDLDAFQMPRADAPISLRTELGLKAEQPIILTLARLAPNKGHRLLIQAAPAILRNYPDAHFLFAGLPDELPSVNAQIHRMNLTAHFSVFGFRSDTVRLLRESNLFVLPSLAEGFALSILEAMAAGVPTIATNVGGAPEIVRDGENGWLVPPSDADALARATILGLSLNPAQRSQMEHAAWDTARRFSLEAMAQQMHEIYCRAIQDHSAKLA